MKLPLTESAPKREWLIDSWLPANCGVLFTGEGGVGKSFLAMQIAAQLMMGKENWAAFKAASQRIDSNKSPINIVFASYEDEAEEFHRRFRWINKQLQWVDIEQIAERFTYVDMKKCGPVWGPHTGEHVSVRGALLPAGAELQKICESEGARLLILDPSAGAYGGNENDRSSVRSFTGEMVGWGEENKCAVMTIAHPPKSDEAYSGSTDWKAGNRAFWTLAGGKDEIKADKGEQISVVNFHRLSYPKGNYRFRDSNDKILTKFPDSGVWQLTTIRALHSEKGVFTMKELDALADGDDAVRERLKEDADSDNLEHKEEDNHNGSNWRDTI